MGRRRSSVLRRRRDESRCCGRSSLDSSRRGRPLDSDLSDGIGKDLVCFSCGKSGHAATCCSNLNESFPFMQPGWWSEKTPTPGVTRPTQDGKRRLIRGEGFASRRLYCTVRPQDPGEGATSVATPRLMKTDDIAELFRLGPPVVPSRISVVLVEETSAGDTSQPECPCDDQERQPLVGTNGPLGGTVYEGDTRLPCGGGVLTLPVLPGGSFRLMLRRHQLCLLRDLGWFPRGFRWCWSMGPWLGTFQDGSVRVRTGFGDRGSAKRGRPVCLWVAAMMGCRVLWKCYPPLMWPEGPFRWCLMGGSSSVGTANHVGSDGPVVAGGPVGPCETLSPLFHDALGPLEHSVLDETILGLDPLEHSCLDHAGPVGQHVARGPVGPDETLLGLDPLEHSVLDCADPAGRHAAVGPVGLFGTLSPSDCYPAGPAGPHVAGGPVGPDEKFWIR